MASVRDQLIEAGVLVPNGEPTPPSDPNLVVFRMDERGRRAAAARVKNPEREEYRGRREERAD